VAELSKKIASGMVSFIVVSCRQPPDDESAAKASNTALTWSVFGTAGDDAASSADLLFPAVDVERGIMHFECTGLVDHVSRNRSIARRGR
jgi:hypothetical protein